MLGVITGAPRPGSSPGLFDIGTGCIEAVAQQEEEWGKASQGRQVSDAASFSSVGTSHLVVESKASTQGHDSCGQPQGPGHADWTSSTAMSSCITGS